MKQGREPRVDTLERHSQAEVARMRKLIVDHMIANDVLREDLYGRPGGRNAGGGS